MIDTKDWDESAHSRAANGEFGEGGLINRVDAAARMYGVGSRQHLAAQARFPDGGPHTQVQENRPKTVPEPHSDSETKAHMTTYHGGYKVGTQPIATQHFVAHATNSGGIAHEHPPAALYGREAEDSSEEGSGTHNRTGGKAFEDRVAKRLRVLKMKRSIPVDAKDWDENAHFRASNGEFGEGGGSAVDKAPQKLSAAHQDEHDKIDRAAKATVDSHLKLPLIRQHEFERSARAKATSAHLADQAFHSGFSPPTMQVMNSLSQHTSEHLRGGAKSFEELVYKHLKFLHDLKEWNEDTETDG